ncbi:oligoendopeptidase F [Jonquetella anthropi]|uniref:oligoendopeptidase F n=1 Tax=Jonquetella anthropi TaxID=428712 RepID=UPI0001B9114E|nr:oligoendopeptidase F [Jonquetella anthropi]EEX49202.1 oligoendopeptidase F [Jonquetella anthropi E3_33 E1]
MEDSKKKIAPAFDRRSDVPQEFCWRLEDLFAAPADWEKAAARVEELSKELAARRGRVMESSRSLLETLKLEEEMDGLLARVYQYAHCRSHEDMSDPKGKDLSQKATALAVRAAEATSFLEPEMLAAPREQVERWLDEPELSVYRLSFLRLWRAESHVLPSEQEAILAAMGEVAGGPEEIFSQLTDADLTFPSVQDEEGRTAALTQESYGRYIQSPSRSVRQAAFTGLHGTFAKYGNALAAAYGSHVKSDRVFARLRRYKSPLEAALFDSEVPVTVYRGLIDAVHRGLPALAGYVSLKKRLLGVEPIRMWDLYAPVEGTLAREWSFDQAVSLVEEALAPLGPEYGAALHTALTDRWIDRYENKGKRSGAYSWGSWGCHPFMLLNYGGTFRDVSTLAHEAGHSMHSWFSQKSQPQVYSDYVIFVAEVASTVNETLLCEHMLARTSDPSEQVFLLSNQLEAMRQTIYRQALFAEFEERAHDADAAGQALTPELLGSIWTELNTAYYGAEVGSTEGLSVEWSRIPHFYGSFYVYQYATGMAAAVALADRILHDPHGAEDYFTLLRGGCSADPVTLLRRAGVDMERDAVDRALAVFAEKTDQLARLTDR